LKNLGPIDYTYYKSQQSSTASRLYELLGVKFYGLSAKGNSFIRYKYSTLCHLLPLTRQRYYSKAKEKLDTAHKELVTSGFLEKYQWTLSHTDRKQNDWYITYYPGGRARGEIQRHKNKKGFSKKPETITLFSKTQLKSIDRLESIGVSKVTAAQLVANSNIRAIQKWIKAVQHIENINDKPAYLVKAIKENWQLPESYRKDEKVRAEVQRREKFLKCKGRGFYEIEREGEIFMSKCDHKKKKENFLI
jgi:hypothetical protein